MRNGQGPIGSILGFGVGLASEAIQYRRERKAREAATQRNVEDDGMLTRPRTPSANPVLQRLPTYDPPAYSEVADTAAAHEAEKFDMKDDGRSLYDDDVDWELDEAARDYGPPSTPSCDNSESAEPAKQSQLQEEPESDKVANKKRWSESWSK